MKIPMLLFILLSVTQRSVNAEMTKRDIANLMEKIEDKCDGDEDCMKRMYKKLESSISNESNEMHNGGDLRSVDVGHAEQKDVDQDDKLGDVAEETAEQLERELDELRETFDYIMNKQDLNTDQIHDAGNFHQPGPQSRTENKSEKYGTEIIPKLYDEWGEKGKIAQDERRENDPAVAMTEPEGFAWKEDMDSMTDKIHTLTGINVDWSDIKAMNDEERVKWKQEMRSRLQEAKSERKRERDELKRQSEVIRDRKKELEYYQREMLRELEEEINELDEEKKELLKEKDDIDKEMNKRLSYSYHSTEPPF